MVVISRFWKMGKVPIRLGRLRTTVCAATPTAVADIRVHTPVGDVTSASASAVQLRAASAGRVCRVCTKNESRYTCPRCNLPYCSVDCYRSHGQSCTEQFYQDHVTNEMVFSERATAAVDPKVERQRSTQQLLARVKQFHDETSHAFEDDSDTDDVADAVELGAERLAELALLDDSELSLENLTSEDRARFLADVASGRMSKYVMPWEPWWLMGVNVYEKETGARRRKLIVEVIDGTPVNMANGDNEHEDDGASISPTRFPATIFTKEMERAMPPSMGSLVRGTVSPCLPFHLVEFLFAYSFTMRTFNGDWKQDPEDAALGILHCSDVLREDRRFATLEEVVIKCLEQIDVEGSLQSATNLLALSDVAQIAAHRMFVLDALTELVDLVREAAEEITRTRLNAAGGDGKQKRGSKSDRSAVRTLQSVQKKIEFYRVWQYHSNDSNSELVAELLWKLGNQVKN